MPFQIPEYVTRPIYPVPEVIVSVAPVETTYLCVAEISTFALFGNCTFIPLIKYFLVGMLENCLESNLRKANALLG